MQSLLENRLLNLIALIATIGINGLATGLPINGKTTGEISALYPSLFTPAGFTFSIWGLIYIALLAYTIYQLLPAQRDSTTLDRIGPYFKLSCLANALWIFVWHYQVIWLSLVLMLCLLYSLIMIYKCLRSAKPLQPTDYALVQVPVSLYIGWITVASIANLSALQTGMGWDNVFFAAIFWTQLKLALAGVIAAIMILCYRDAVFGLVVAWAAYGISAKQLATPEVAGAALTLSLLAVLLIIAVLINGLLANRQASSTNP